ncbi:hypothetical protein T09_13730 [Trichinella sp. T9]|nr:hypothetical protein T09_13730 [Trichinella sp. T9]
MFAKQLDKGHIWLGAIAWTGVLPSEKEANEEERLSSHEKKFEENESHNATLRVRDVNRGTVNLINFLFLFLVVIMAESEGIYSVGCREGKLSSKFTAANLQDCSN